MSTARMAGWIIGMILMSQTTHAQKDLVAHYVFDEGSWAVVHDSSGNRNDGKIVGEAKWVQGAYGSALEFNGSDTYVDCGATDSLNSVASAGTLEIWCRPNTLQGGLVNWSTGGGWNDERLVMAIDTYHGGHTLMGAVADGSSSQSFLGFGALEEKEWVHLAVSFDGKIINVYRDGLLNASTVQSLKPEIKGVPLWIGRCQGLGMECFQGIIKEVRIHSRALRPEEVFASYKKEAVKMGKDTTYFRKVRIEATAYPGPGMIIARLDIRAMQPLPPGTALYATLSKSGSVDPIKRERIAKLPSFAGVDVKFDAQGLAPGEYLIRSSAIASDGKRVGNESEMRVTWSGQPEEFKGVKILNNLVWELLNVRARGKRDVGPAQVFNNPCDRWVFLRTVAEVKPGAELSVFVDSQESPVITYAEGSTPALEAMQYLKAGKHTLRIKADREARLKQLVARSIPMLQHAFYGANPHIAPHGPYDWEFLKKDILPNVNTMIGAAGPELEQWKKSGRKWISIVGLPQFQGTDDAAVDLAYKHWSESPGFQNPLMDGVIVDEFGGGDDPSYDVYRKAVERLYATPEFKGKMFIPYGGAFYGKDRSQQFARLAIDGGGYVAWEVYLREEQSEEAARAALKSISDTMVQWEKGLPGVTRRMVMVYGYMSQPNESLNADPSTDFRDWMDMQLHELATHPSFFGLGGIQEYHSAYCDEENVRLAGRLYRHYAIEGNTQPLIRDPYRLSHVQNPDFADGTRGWTTSPAEEGSIQTKENKGISWVEGRYPPTPMGNTFLWMKRSAAKPNVFSQTIQNLTPGRLYSMKMMTADYQDLLQEKSSKATNAVSIKLDNVEILPGPKSSFQFTFPNCYAHIVGKFNAQYPFWMNYHWRVFRAKGTTATLTVSDWENDTAPGGPVGQEQLYNFIEVQPYIGE